MARQGAIPIDYRCACGEGQGRLQVRHARAPAASVGCRTPSHPRRRHRRCRHEDFVARIAELTGGRRVDTVFDGIGGAHVRRSFECLGHGGRLVCFGFTAADLQQEEGGGGGGGWDGFVTHTAIASFQARFWSTRWGGEAAHHYFLSRLLPQLTPSAWQECRVLRPGCAEVCAAGGISCRPDSGEARRRCVSRPGLL